MDVTSNIGINVLWTDKLQPLEKRGLILLRAYEKCCRKACGSGFRTDPITNESCRDRPSFKQAVTVARWLDCEGMRVGCGEINWEGFVEYVFEDFSTRNCLPAVGQLKNKVLLQKYFQHASISYAPGVAKSNDWLEELYARIVLPEVAADVGMLHLLGLIRSDRAEDNG